MSEMMKLKLKLGAWLVVAAFPLYTAFSESHETLAAGDRSQWGQALWHLIIAVVCWIGFFYVWDKIVPTYRQIKAAKAEKEQSER